MLLKANLLIIMGNSKTSKYYAENPKARAKRLESQKEINKSPEKIKYRSELNKANRDGGTYGKMKQLGLDRSHTKDGRLVLEKTSINRARNGANGKSTKK